MPLTVAALLEARAMAAEMAASSPLLGQLPQPEQTVERSSYTARMLATFYDPFLTRYIVAAHAVANVLHIQDIPTALALASQLAWVTLNLTQDLFQRIRIPALYETTWGGRNQAAMQRCDRGYAYAMILENSRHNKKIDMPNLVDWVLHNAGLPTQSEIYASASQARRQIYNSDVYGPYSERFNDLSKLADRLGEPADAVDGMLGFQRDIRPPVLSGDNQWMSVGSSKMTGTFANPSDWVERAHASYRRFDEFLAACVF